MNFFALIRYNLANLANFSGRERRAIFWPYVAFVIGMAMVGMMALMLPAMAQTFGKMQQFAQAHPDQATIQSGPGSYSITIQGHHPELMPDMSAFITGNTVIAVIVICLLAAAVVRRLHDRAKSGFWGLLPLPFLSFGLIAMPRIFTQTPPDMTLFFTIFINNMIYLGALVTLIVLLAGDGSVAENRYGAPTEPH